MNYNSDLRRYSTDSSYDMSNYQGANNTNSATSTCLKTMQIINCLNDLDDVSNGMEIMATSSSNSSHNTMSISKSRNTNNTTAYQLLSGDDSSIVRADGTINNKTSRQGANHTTNNSNGLMLPPSQPNSTYSDLFKIPSQQTSASVKSIGNGNQTSHKSNNYFKPPLHLDPTLAKVYELDNECSVKLKSYEENNAGLNPYSINQSNRMHHSRSPLYGEDCGDNNMDTSTHNNKMDNYSIDMYSQNCGEYLPNDMVSFNSPYYDSYPNMTTPQETYGSSHHNQQQHQHLHHQVTNMETVSGSGQELDFELDSVQGAGLLDCDVDQVIRHELSVEGTLDFGLATTSNTSNVVNISSCSSTTCSASISSTTSIGSSSPPSLPLNYRQDVVYTIPITNNNSSLAQLKAGSTSQDMVQMTSGQTISHSISGNSNNNNNVVVFYTTANINGGETSVENVNIDHMAQAGESMAPPTSSTSVDVVVGGPGLIGNTIGSNASAAVPTSATSLVNDTTNNLEASKQSSSNVSGTPLSSVSGTNLTQIVEIIPISYAQTIASELSSNNIGTNTNNNLSHAGSNNSNIVSIHNASITFYGPMPPVTQSYISYGTGYVPVVNAYYSSNNNNSVHTSNNNSNSNNFLATTMLSTGIVESSQADAVAVTTVNGTVSTGNTSRSWVH